MFVFKIFESLQCILEKKAITQRDIRLKLSLRRHRVKLLKDANTLIKDKPVTNFLSAYADGHVDLKIPLQDARNRRQVVRFADEKDFIDSFAKTF